MKKNYLTILVSLCLFTYAQCAQYTISTVGISFSPSLVNAVVGDTITINASSNHPTAQVSMATWNANGTTPVGGGWGVVTSSFTFQISSPSDIYFVCQNHVGSGMKGRILVTASNILENVGQNNIRILNNPVSDGVITVMNTMDKSGILNIYDLGGKLLDSKELSNDVKQIIEVSLPKGLYLYRFNMDGNLSSANKLYIFSERY